MQDKHYSKALERCIEYTKDEGDIVGLLSYALYKSTLREAARSDDGYLPASHQRNLTTNQLKQLSNLASSMLADYADKQHPQSSRDAVVAIKELEKKLTAYPSAIIKGFVVSLCVLAVWVILNLSFYGFTSKNLIKLALGLN